MLPANVIDLTRTTIHRERNSGAENVLVDAVDNTKGIILWYYQANCSAASYIRINGGAEYIYSTEPPSGTSDAVCATPILLPKGVDLSVFANTGNSNIVLAYEVL
tara:strand:- start:69 stop:383 length:315 start_codon:yes stop_codon:yes gene_type:complete